MRFCYHEIDARLDQLVVQLFDAARDQLQACAELAKAACAIIFNRCFRFFHLKGQRVDPFFDPAVRLFCGALARGQLIVDVNFCHRAGECRRCCGHRRLGDDGNRERVIVAHDTCFLANGPDQTINTRLRFGLGQFVLCAERKGHDAGELILQRIKKR